MASYQHIGSRKKHSVKATILFAGVLLLLVSCTQPTEEVLWDDARTTHYVSQNDNLPVNLLWEREVFTVSGLKDIQVVAFGGKVFFLGSTDSTEPFGIVAMQGDNGKALWVKQSNFSNLAVNSDALYVGKQSYIYALDIETGDEIWSTKLPGLHNNVMYLYAVDNILYTRGSTSGQHLKDIKTGNVFDTTQPFKSLPAGILNYVPAITKEKIFLGAGLYIAQSGTAYQRSPYQFLWRTEKENVISNVAASENVAYFLTYDDELLMLDANTGDKLGAIHFEPSINFFEDMGASQHDGYRIAVDGENNLLYVILGDSNQMFAFEILLDAEVQ